MRNSIGFVCTLAWVIALNFLWDWWFPDSAGTFSFTQVAVAALGAPLFYGVGESIGECIEQRGEEDTENGGGEKQELRED